MPDVWLPGAYRDPGRNAGYSGGRSSMQRAVAHYTVGADSRNVGRDGYFHFLIHRDASRENGCTQYAEVDAITWHAANQGNPYGPGIEYERMTTGGVNAEGLSNAEPLTENQLQWGGRIRDFCAEHGIPAQLYDGPRYGATIMPGGPYRGWVNHQAIDSSRSDGLTRAEWNALGSSPAPDVDDTEDDDVLVIVCTEKGPWGGLWIITDFAFGHYNSVNAMTPGRTLTLGAAGDVQWWLDRMNENREAIGAPRLAYV